MRALTSSRFGQAEKRAIDRLITASLETASIDPVIIPETALIWRTAYDDMLDRTASIVARARLTFCGLGACVDATVSLHDAGALFEARQPREAVALAAALLGRAATGTGGEMRVAWPQGPAWLDDHVPMQLRLGGTGPHAARALSTLGAPALLALDTRSPEQLSVLDSDIMLAERGRRQPARMVAPSRPNAVKIYIFEYTKGRPIRGVVPPRSSRIIVRFTDPGLENDAEFDALSVTMAPDAGAGILSGFSAIGGGDLDGPLERARRLAQLWVAGGLSTVHLELAGYDLPQYRDRVLAALTGSITSLGLSFSEFNALVPNLALADGMVALGRRLRLRRVCVHADEWAASATLDDPDVEREALLLGCLLASARAAHGRPVVPSAIPGEAVFETPPLLPESLDGWHIVACAAPYLVRPITTVGLGDTFMAGCLLVLGQHPNVSLDPQSSRSGSTSGYDRTQP